MQLLDVYRRIRSLIRGLGRKGILKREHPAPYIYLIPNRQIAGSPSAMGFETQIDRYCLVIEHYYPPATF